ncbi:MAG: hypothetical protein H6591_05025 [Flavobacteriales bacterium]|nr:hypothetical protein [Flavobacteriales bacterium]
MRTLDMSLACVLLIAGCSTGTGDAQNGTASAKSLDSVTWDEGDPEVEKAARQICSCFVEAMRAGSDKETIDELIRDMDSTIGLKEDERELRVAELEEKYKQRGLDRRSFGAGWKVDCFPEEEMKRLMNLPKGGRKIFLIKKTLELKCVPTRVMFEHER